MEWAESKGVPQRVSVVMDMGHNLSTVVGVSEVSCFFRWRFDVKTALKITHQYVLNVLSCPP